MIALGGEVGQRPGGRRRARRPARARPEAERDALRGRGDRLPRRPQLGGRLDLHSAGIQQTLETLNQELRDKVEKIAEQQRRILILQDQLTDRRRRRAGGEAVAARPKPEVFDEIKGSGKAVGQMIALARKVAASPSAVLIRGESGTGKEMLAEAIHAASPRAARPFVKVHCAALSQSLLESELFGHVKGAFTGADRDRVGRFEQANGGTLFLDEIGDINLEVQTKLLRVLQEMSFERVGSSQPITVDVRILAATHQDLEAMIRAGRFREDLYYRLNVFRLHTPPCASAGRTSSSWRSTSSAGRPSGSARRSPTSTTEAVEALVAYDWPGNIRELENVIERAVVLADGPAITADDLPVEVRQPTPPRRRRARVRLWPACGRGQQGRPHHPGADRPTPPAPPRKAGMPSSSASNASACVDALAEAQGNKSEAARLLGMPRSTLCSKLEKHGLFDKGARARGQSG